jgi:hypothetical protein
MAYNLEGKLLEVCNCRVLCPCWVGEDPDYGTCDTIVAWNMEKGDVDGVDVSGRTIAVVAHVPGNILEGNWRAAVFIDDGATDAQQEALLSVYTGQQGGPVADLVQLIGEVVSVERAPIRFTVAEGKGVLEIGTEGNYYAELEPFQGTTGEPTTLANTVFSTVPGNPVFAAKAASYRSKNEALGIDHDLKGHNALQTDFVFHG